MSNRDKIRDLVEEYWLGYYFNPGGIEFFSPIFKDIESCQVSEYVAEDEEDFNKLLNWIELNKEKLMREKPKKFVYYSEGIIQVYES